jgi:RNase adaptor protein for sRNA GlmZ degradation
MMNKKLNIEVNSFSFKKKGIPADDSGNGGGFIFDCRGILNPGRIEEYKQQTGMDAGVRNYLETQTEMPTFLALIKGIIDISIKDYLARGFENLQINFGCTGGQHRSVYCADVIGKYIAEKYNLDIAINHHEQPQLHT